MEITDAFPASAKALMLVFSQMSSEIFGLCDMITCNRLCMFTPVLVTLSHLLWLQNSLKNKTFETTNYFTVLNMSHLFTQHAWLLLPVQVLIRTKAV